MLLGGVASAKVLDRGGTVRVAREAPLKEWHLFVFVPRDGDLARLQSLSAAIPGQRYSVLDERGYLGEASVTRAQKIEGYDARCPGEFYYESDARWQRATQRQIEGWMLAIGPSADPLRRARVVPAHRVKTRIPPLVDGKLLSIAIDLDGEGEPELYSLDYHCDGDRLVRRGTGRELCVEFWAHEGDRWEVVARARTPVCGN
jgi:hypothetical protein